MANARPKPVAPAPTTVPMPGAGGSYEHNPATGELAVIKEAGDDTPAEPSPVTPTE